MVQGRKWRVAWGRKWQVVLGVRWDGGKRPWPPVAALVALGALLVPAASAAHPARAGLEPSASRGVLVVPAHGRSAAARALVAQLGGHAGDRIGVARGFAARIPADRLAALRASRAVHLVAPDVALHVDGADGAAGDAEAASDMGVVRSASGAQALQDAGVDGTGVGVALIDSGVVRVDGVGDVVYGPDFSADAGDPTQRNLDAFGHGTNLAGVIGGHGDGFTGVAPGARVISVKVADAAGRTSLLRVLQALDWVRRHHADDGLDVRVVNLSLGVTDANAGYVHAPLAYAAEALWRSGLVVVAAAGNRGAKAKALDLPAADPFVVAVGALDTNGTADRGDDSVASFSSRSDSRGPDVIAPGTKVASLRVPGSVLDVAFPAAQLGTRYFRGSGTSQGTAVVSGLAALLLEQRPSLTPDQLKALLERGAKPVAVDGNRAAAEGAGAVDAAASAALAVPADATQRFAPAVLDLRALASGGAKQRMAAGSARWAGSTWSGSTWSGSTWSGSTWSGSTWSGSTWSGSTWSSASWGADG